MLLRSLRLQNAKVLNNSLVAICLNGQCCGNNVLSQLIIVTDNDSLKIYMCACLCIMLRINTNLML